MVKRPLALCMAGSLCAFSLCLCVPQRWFLPLAASALCLVLCSLVSAGRFSRTAWLFPVFCGLLFGLVWRTGYDHLLMEPARMMAGCNERVTAIVLEKRSYGLVLRAEVNGRRFKAYYKVYDTSAFAPGDRLTFSAVFSLPSNSGDFNGERYYTAQGIPVCCTPSGEPEVEKNAVPLYAAYDRVRQGALSLVSRLFGKLDGEMAALLLGEKSVLPSGTRTALAATGLSHTFVVSGMHLSFIVSMLAFLRGRKGYLAVVLPAALLFAVFSGMGYAVIRAFLMLFYALMADALCLPRDRVTELVSSLFLILLFNPYALLHAGLIFSYLAVCGLFLLFPRLRFFLSAPLMLTTGPMRAVLEALITTFAASLSAGVATLPAAVLYMQHFSAIFLISNLLLLWMVEAIFVLGAIALAFGALWVPLGKLLALPVTWLLSLFLKTNAFLASLPYAEVGVDSLYLPAAIILSVALLFIFAARKKPLLRPLPLSIMLLSLLSALLFTELDAASRSFTLTVLPTDRACALLSVRGVNFLIGYDDEAADLLVRKNIARPDYLILSEQADAARLPPTFSAGELLVRQSAAFHIGETTVTLSPEGNLMISAADATVSVLLAPGLIRKSDAYLFSREALRSPLISRLTEDAPVYVFGSPPRNPDETIHITQYAYLSGELTFILANGRLTVRN